MTTSIETRLHTADTAPEAARPLLEGAQKALGFVPNLFAVMAESPAHLQAYQTLNELVVSKTSLTSLERTVVWMTINVENECHYCVAAHTAIAHQEKIDPAIIEALREGTSLGNERLEALRSFTQSLVRGRGWVDDGEVRAFKEAGYSEQHILDIVLVLSQKILSNYTNHLFTTPVDGVFQKFQASKNAA